MTDHLVPDSKDWTWVLTRPCPECGLAAGEVPLQSLGARIRENAASWATALLGPAIEVRPSTETWSVARVRLPRPRRAPGDGRACCPDRAGGRSGASPTGTRTPLRSRRGTPSRIRPSSPPSSWLRLLRLPSATTGCPTTPGSAAAGAATAVSSRSPILVAITCTTWSITSTTSRDPMKQATVAAYDASASAYLHGGQPMSDLRRRAARHVRRHAAAGSAGARDRQWPRS